MTTLGDIIDKRLLSDQHISLHDYMDLALYHPEFGYYCREQVIGEVGDFITAPEISQMFGELTGLWLAHQCQSQHLETKTVLVELGPGRGTLMADMIRAWRQTSLTLPPVHLVETSPSLKNIQANTLSHITETDLHWHQSVDNLPDQPLLVIANEFFDALPVQQFRYADAAWQERRIASGSSGWDLTWEVMAADAIPHVVKEMAMQQPSAQTNTDASIITYAPDLPDIISSLSKRIANHGGAMLIIDYGKADPFGDTVQAIHQHKPVDILAHPGAADLTSWVDFSLIAHTAVSHGLLATPLLPQGQFLKSIGIMERAEQLSANANSQLRRQLLAELDRLVNPAHMGQAFKVMALIPQNTIQSDASHVSELPGWSQPTPAEQQ